VNAAALHINYVLGIREKMDPTKNNEQPVMN